MAQPLTVLRGALGAWKMRGASEAASDRYLEMSVKQVERMSDLLGCLRDVLDTAQGERRCDIFDLRELLDHVLDGMSSTLREWGGRIERIEPDEPILISADADRTERALRAALRAAVSVSSVQGAFRVSTRLSEGRAELVVEAASAVGRTLNATERLNLRLVENNIRSQDGGYQCVEDPFRLAITLPAHDSKERALESHSESVQPAA